MHIVMIAFSNLEYTIELTEALAQLENVTLMISKKDLKRFGRVINPNVRVFPFFFPRMRYPTNVFMALQIIFKLYRLKPDVVHLQKGNPWFNLFIPLLRRFCLVTTIHDVILLDWPSQRIPAFTYIPPIKYANKLIVHGEKLKSAMITEYRRPANDIYVLPRGVNSIYARYERKAAAEEEPHTIMYFGRIWSYKGLKYLIEAEPLISEKVPDVKIIIAGAGEDFGIYRDMMVHKDRFVVYNEFIPDERVNELFSRASVVVLPYTDGSQSGVIPQAYAFKKPVVITEVGSLPENVDDGVTGLIVPPKDSGKLAEAIIDLLLDDEKRKRMGENAYRKVNGELAWKNIAPRTIAVYNEALRERGMSTETGRQSNCS
jgi:glycosyltransferase involved in cell wall biosynthesis